MSIYGFDSWALSLGPLWLWPGVTSYSFGYHFGYRNAALSVVSQSSILILNITEDFLIWSFFYCLKHSFRTLWVAFFYPRERDQRENHFRRLFCGGGSIELREYSWHWRIPASIGFISVRSFVSFRPNSTSTCISFAEPIVSRNVPLCHVFPFVAGEVSGGGGGASLYFRKAHSKSEVVRQPSSLKGGVLKEYQLQGLQWMVRFCLWSDWWTDPNGPCFDIYIGFCI